MTENESVRDKTNQQEVFSMIESDVDIDYSLANKRPQILAAMAAAFSAFAMGAALGWSSPVQPQLQQNSTLNQVTNSNSTWYIYLDDDQMSWVGSLINIGALIGAFAGGFLMDRFGRSFTLMLMSIPFLIGWLLIALAVDPYMLYAGRVFGGLAAGISSATAPCYIGEISTPTVRGIVGYFFSINIGLGITFSSLLGMGLDWRWISAADAITAILLFIFMYLVPESPYYLVKKNDLPNAAKALAWLRGDRYNIDAELLQIKIRVREDNTIQFRYNDFFRPWAYKPILIGLAVMLFQQFSGMNAALFYSVDILRAANSNLDALVAGVIVAFMTLVGNYFGIILVTRLGRRPLLMLSEGTSCVSMGALGAYFYILRNDPETAQFIAWLPLASLVLFIAGLAMGIGPLGWLISSEVLPAKIRGQGCAIAALSNFAYSFIITKTFIDLQRAVTPAGAFWFYGIVSFVGILFGWFILPETKDKTSDEINAIFYKKKEPANEQVNL